MVSFTKDSRGLVTPLTQVVDWRSGYKSLLGDFSDEKVLSSYYGSAILHYIATHSPSGQDRPEAGRYFGVLHHQGFGVLDQLCPLQLWIMVRLAFSS